MSTRATVHFDYGSEPEAIIYRHSDGYPEGLGKDLQRFFQDVQEQTKDQRFTDPSYLAAKFVVWQAWEYVKMSAKWSKSTTQPHRLDFLSVGVHLRDPEDIEYRYHVDCSQNDEKGFPPVTCEKGYKDNWQEVKLT